MPAANWCHGIVFSYYGACVSHHLRVLEVARTVVDDVALLVSSGTGPLARDTQVLRSSQSIAANIREALGRRPGPERNQFFRVARGSAEETDEHLNAHYRQKRIVSATYWRVHHRLIVCIKMLNSMLQNPAFSSRL
jgi:four helix bundle protein